MGWKALEVSYEGLLGFRIMINDKFLKCKG